MNILIAGGALLLAMSLPANAQERFASMITLPNGKTVVVAEGDFEPRSIGSFSVRLYEKASAGNQAAFFSPGAIRARDGAVEKLILADLDMDEEPEVIVTVRSVGTGGYLSAHAFSVAEDQLIFRAAACGLPADADPVVTLRKLLRHKK